MRSNHINGIHGINDSGSDRHAAQGRNLPDGRSTFSQIFSDIDWQLPPDQLPSFHLFADNLYKFASQAQLTRCSKETLTSSTLALWTLLQQRADEEIKLTLYNPPCNEPNKAFTVLAVVLPDMPFIVDSLRMALSRNSLYVDQLHNAVLTVVRDEAGRMDAQALSAHGEDSGTHPDQDGTSEAILLFQLELIASETMLTSLHDDLSEMLYELSIIVNDFKSVVEITHESRSELAALIRTQSIADTTMLQESVDFLDWLLADHYIFLGVKEYRFEPAEGQAEGKRDEMGCFVPIESSSLGILRVERDNDILEQLNCALAVTHQPLEFAKSAVKSRHHRSAYPDIIMVRRFDSHGRLIGERRFIGLYTSRVYNTSCQKIPYVRRKFSEVMHRSGFSPSGHDAKALIQILESYPREELFQTPVDELYSAVVSIVLNQDHPELQLFMRRDPFGRFLSALIYVPRDAFNTEVRLKFQSILLQSVDAQELDYSTLISESQLARLHLTLRLDPLKKSAYNLDNIKRRLTEAARTWHDVLQSSARNRLSPQRVRTFLDQYSKAFPAAYREDFSPEVAITDFDYLERLQDDKSLEINLYRRRGDPEDELRIKLYYCSRLQTLSDIVPILENLGFLVLSARPYAVMPDREEDVTARRRLEYHINDYRVRYCDYPGTHCSAEGAPLSESRMTESEDHFCQAFTAIWRGELDNDPLNRLVLAAQLSWRQVALLRAYGHYLTQIKVGFSQSYIQEALLKNIDITQRLVGLFDDLFNPAHDSIALRIGVEKNGTKNSEKQQEHERESEGESEGESEKGLGTGIDEEVALIKSAIEEVSNLDEDRILTRYLQVILATLRTNFYQPFEMNQHESISLKLSPALIPNMPKPIPHYEIFLFSPKVEGVHLRAGKVARGGLRWSDRREDYRTEILGLVKAQQVKNAVIVPVGAKGGFVIKRTPESLQRDERFEYGRACYRIFIRGLLSLADNLVEGEVVSPEWLVRRDDDDPYLVIAADKGTATFSDTANEEAAATHFWMGDGFASGGSDGYDHKKMGITTRGAWVSVERHFRELGHNVQRDPFTVIGIGDMGGDVFGNGMLQSEAIQLVAAFNHQHIFIDPNPDPKASFKERQRLFNLPRSSWSDYSEGLISTGGGVFHRNAKQIALSKEAKARFGVSADALTPTELIKAILQAPADLLWNGGIGTYVKSREESSVEVGDKANDDLRINGAQLRVRVVGEGGNLGLTQLGRIEYARAGGLCNTDFIDNAAGVACSDQEVNIKILLNAEVAAEHMTLQQRNRLLIEMTEQVAANVLHGNYRQVQAISLALCQIGKRMGEYRRFIHYLEDMGRMDRQLEGIPSDDEIVARKNAGEGLTRPELSVLMAYAKALLKEQLLDERLSSDPMVSKEIESTLPARLASEFRDPLYDHKLKGELIATHIANNMVNQMGATFMKRLEDASGADPVEIAVSWLAVEEIFELKPLWLAIEALDYKVAADIQMEMMLELVRLSRGATRWLLRNFRGELDIAQLVAKFKPGVSEIKPQLSALVLGVRQEAMNGATERYLAAGVPEALAHQVASASNLRLMLSMIQAAESVQAPLARAVEHYFSLGETLHLYWLSNEIEKLAVENHWEALAREALRDDLEWQQRALTVGLLQLEQLSEHRDNCLDSWLSKQQHMVERWDALLEEIKATQGRDYPLFAVALRELMDLAQSTSHMH